MRSYKAIEQPAQVLGMSFRDLVLGVVSIFVLAAIIGVLGTFMTVPKQIFLLLLVAFGAMIYVLRYLGKNRPPNFFLAWLSFHTKQPRRIALGPSSLIAPSHVRTTK